MEKPEELENRLRKFFTEPSVTEAKSLVRLVLENQKSFENIVVKMISTANYESLFKIADGCGKIACCAHKTIGVLDYVQKRMERLGEPKNTNEQTYLTLIETQFMWVQKEHASYDSNPPRAYTKPPH